MKDIIQGTAFSNNRREEIEHVVGLISVNSVNLNLVEGRGTGESE